MKITVIIPIINEENTIADVVVVAKNNPNVDEVIVVDDHSIDDSVAKAKAAGASVIISTKIGKGASMYDGLLVSKNDIIVYIDGDINNYESDIIERLTRPLLDGKADFVKGVFDRKAGRVTELVAKPLLSLLFPDALRFTQPLSGMIAGKRQFFEKLTFENDYGVDIGILLDMLKLNAKIEEANVGSINHKMKQWQQLGKMSREVANAILKRARAYQSFSLDSLNTTMMILDQVDYAVKDNLAGLKKMVIFDMDNTILMGRYIDKLAEKYNFKKDLIDIVTTNQENYLITKMIARLLKGLNIAQLIAAADEIPLVSDIISVVAELKKRGYVVGIISDSYDFAVQHLKNKINADFAIANELEFSNSVATGEVKVLSCFTKNAKSRCNHSFCKSNVMMHISEKYNISLDNIIAVGDGENDICMVKFAGIGVAFCAANQILNLVADKIIDSKTFTPILEFAI
jgi:phosphoserine phosphatase SerB